MTAREWSPASDVGTAMLDRLGAADGLFVGLDFDGTLAPIAHDPDAPVVTEDCERGIRDLVARPNADVAVISGRELSDLVSRVGVDGILYAGNHGLELRREGDVTVHPIAASLESAVRQARDNVLERVGDVPGCAVEDKELTATVHFRQSPDDRVDEIRSAVESAVSDADGSLRVVSGKQVFEIRPAIGWDKGSAIDLLSADAPDGWRTVYVGDDTTDEDAFRAIEPDGVGVLVGERSETAASYRLPEQEQVAPFLEWLADAALDGDDTATTSVAPDAPASGPRVSNADER